MDNKKSYWPHAIVGFFIVVFSYNFWFAYNAGKSSLGSVEDSTYEKSKNYQEVIDLKTESKKLNWKAKYIQADTLIVKIIDNNSEISDLDVELNAVCLSCKDREFIENLRYDKSLKAYVVSEALAQGQWYFRLKAKKGNQVFYDEQKELIN